MRGIGRAWFSRWSEKGGRAYGLKAVVSILRRAHPTPKVVVEIGCGLGFMSQYLTELGHFVVSMDISEAALRAAQANLASLSNLQLMRADAQSLPFLDNGVDIVVAYDVIEHLPRPEDFLSESYRVLKPRGILMTSTPNPSSLGCRLKRRHQREAGKRYSEHSRWEWVGFRDKTHISIRSIDEWRATCAHVGFHRLRDGTDFLWDPPYFRIIPMFLQKLLFNGTTGLIKIVFGFLPWTFGENYYAVWRKP